MSIRQTALALIVAAAAVPVFAQTGGTWINGEIGFVPDPPKSQVTREQVKQELASFLRQGGRISNGEIGFVPDPPKSQLTREQVKQELASFLRQGGRVAAGEMLAVIPAGSAVTAASTASTATLGNAPATSPATIIEPFVNGGPN